MQTWGERESECIYQRGRVSGTLCVARGCHTIIRVAGARDTFAFLPGPFRPCHVIVRASPLLSLSGCVCVSLGGLHYLPSPRPPAQQQEQESSLGVEKCAALGAGCVGAFPCSLATFLRYIFFFFGRRDFVSPPVAGMKRWEEEAPEGRGQNQNVIPAKTSTLYPTESRSV